MASSSSLPPTLTAPLDFLPCSPRSPSPNKDIMPELIDLTSQFQRLFTSHTEQHDHLNVNTTKAQWCDPITSDSEHRFECERSISSDTQSECDWSNSILSTKDRPANQYSDVEKSDSDSSSTPTVRPNDSLVPQQLQVKAPIIPYYRRLSSDTVYRFQGTNRSHGGRAIHTRSSRITDDVSDLPNKGNYWYSDSHHQSVYIAILHWLRSA
jgi:hypothetical protein